MGDLENDDYRKNLLSEVTRAFNATKAHEFIVTIPDYPQVAEKMNNERYIENLAFVYINNLSAHLKRYLGDQTS